MGDGHESESAVERLPAKWREIVRKLRCSSNPINGRSADATEVCIAELEFALRKDGAIPERMK